MHIKTYIYLTNTYFRVCLRSDLSGASAIGFKTNHCFSFNRSLDSSAGKRERGKSRRPMRRQQRIGNATASSSANHSGTLQTRVCVSQSAALEHCHALLQCDAEPISSLLLAVLPIKTEDVKMRFMRKNFTWFVTLGTGGKY